MAARKEALAAAFVLLAVFGLVAVAAREEAPGTLTGLRPALAAGLPAMPSTAPRADVVGRVLRRRTVIRRGSRREREIALTFDDGPSPFTRRIVRVLRRARAAATFFPVASLADRWPRGLAAVRRASFEVGDHTVGHPYLPGLSFRGQLREIRRPIGVLARHGLPRPRLMRPPYGAHDRRTRAIA